MPVLFMIFLYWFYVHLFLFENFDSVYNGPRSGHGGCERNLILKGALSDRKRVFLSLSPADGIDDKINCSVLNQINNMGSSFRNFIDHFNC